MNNNRFGEFFYFFFGNENHNNNNNSKWIKIPSRRDRTIDV